MASSRSKLRAAVRTLIKTREWRVSFAAPSGGLRACSIAFTQRLRLDKTA